MASLSKEDTSHLIRQEIIRFESVHPSIYAIYDLIDGIDDKNISEPLRQYVVSIEDSNCEPCVRIDEARARKLANDLKRCSYYETCAAYGLNIDRVFQDACLKVIQSRASSLTKGITAQQNSCSIQLNDPRTVSTIQQKPFHDQDKNLVPQSSERLNLQMQQIPAATANLRLTDPHSEFWCEPDRCDLAVTSRSTQTAPIIQSGASSISVGFPEDGRFFQTINSKIPLGKDQHLQPNCLSGDRNSSCTTTFDKWIAHPILLGCRCPAHEAYHSSNSVSYGYFEAIPHPPSCSTNCGIEYHTFQKPHILTDISDGEAPVRDSAPGSTTGLDALTRVHSSQALGLPHQFIGRTRSPTLVSSAPHNHAQSVVALNSYSIAVNSDLADAKGETNDPITPNSTPTHSRKNRRKSNLFKKNDEERDNDKKVGGIGSGRAIPLKQGILYKRSHKSLSKEWKTKKYVTLTEDGRLTYHPSIQDYMDNAHGKEIDIGTITVKIPGIPFRQLGGRITSNGLLRSQLNETADNFAQSVNQKVSSSVKRRHRRVKSNPKASNATDGYESEGYEFQLVSRDRSWHFEASGPEERNDWVELIEQAITTRLQLNQSSKLSKTQLNPALQQPAFNSMRSTGDAGSMNSNRSQSGDPIESSSAGASVISDNLVQNIRLAAGNDFCADCGNPDPDWASLNLGSLVCISCSGIHRQLGTHISRVRSLRLDDWSPEYAAVMCAVGNTLASSVWEAAVPVNAGNRKKPDPDSPSEEKEAWIRAKYERREFLPPLPYPDAPLQQQLIDAIARQDTRQVILCLALSTGGAINAPYSRQDPRAAIHIAATLGNLVYLQLLLWYNADVEVTDHEGRNAFYYAHCSQKFDCADFLLRNGCSKQMVVQVVPACMPAPGAVGHTPRPFSAVGQHQLVIASAASIPTHAVDQGMPSNTTAQLHHLSHLQQQQQLVPINSASPPMTFSQLQGAPMNSISSQPPVMSGPCGPMPLVGSNITGTSVCHSQSGVRSIPSSAFAPGPAVTATALGATLPRRRAPPLAPAVLQPLNPGPHVLVNERMFGPPTNMRFVQGPGSLAISSRPLPQHSVPPPIPSVGHNHQQIPSNIPVNHEDAGL